jgi:alkylated DNA repair dioxygenase AlkB
LPFQSNRIATQLNHAPEGTLIGGLKSLTDFECHECAKGYPFWVGRLPAGLLFTTMQFDKLWHMHPQEYYKIKIHGRLVKTPRWQQAYGMDYRYTGRVHVALPIHPLLKSLLNWARSTIDVRLNGMLLNWYDGILGHYIGRHRDSTKNMIHGAPIVTISFGEERIFRIRPWRAEHTGEKFDHQAANGSVFVMPYETNLAFTHEVPASSKRKGRRISVTLRGFEERELGGHAKTRA